MKSSELGKEIIKKELPLIPKSPGVYRMLNHKDDILYVGKAKNLPNRLNRYVLKHNHAWFKIFANWECGKAKFFFT